MPHDYLNPWPPPKREKPAEMLLQEEIEARARALQAEGPDEFPWGYYLHLAETEAVMARHRDNPEPPPAPPIDPDKDLPGAKPSPGSVKPGQALR